jgi:CRISPR-associated exonuclease Cas4
MMAMLCLLAAVGAILLVGVWVVTRQQRLKLGEQAWLPEELKAASLEFAERVFYTRWPFRLYAKIDRAYRTPDGAIVLTELKRRFKRQAYQSDVVELSAQKLAIERGAGRRVAATGFVVVEHPGTSERTPILVTLLQGDDLTTLSRRYQLLVNGTATPDKANNVRLCRSCAYVDRCKPDVLLGHRASQINGEQATVQQMGSATPTKQLNATVATTGRPAPRRATVRNPGRSKTKARSSPGSGQSHTP